MSSLAQLAEDHIRSALQRAEADFPDFAVDSWSDTAVPGQWVLIEDSEGRRSQVQLNDVVVLGIALHRSSLSHSCVRLAQEVLGGVRRLSEAGLVVSRPLPSPEDEGIHTAYLEFKGIWLRLTVGSDGGRLVAVLSALLGLGPQPLAEPEEEVTWL